MTPKYWLKIIAGMLGIFVIGMLVVGGIRNASGKVRSVVESSNPLNVPLLGMTFRTGKGELGKLERLRIERSEPGVINGFHFVATLNDGVDVDQFDLCEVTVSNPEHFNRNSTFDCLTAADSGYDDLVNFGTITFKPSGEVHRLMLPSRIRDEIISAFSNSDDAGAEAMATAAADAANDGSRLRVTVEGKTLVDINGDSSEGGVRIVDPRTGRVVVDLKAGPGGANVTIAEPPVPPGGP
jgi:hypothetical protein